MSMINTLSALSKFLNVLSCRLQSKALVLIEDRISKAIDEQQRVEESRESNIAKLRLRYYEDRANASAEFNTGFAKLNDKFNHKMDCIYTKFKDDEFSIENISRVVSGHLKSEITALEAERESLLGIK